MSSDAIPTGEVDLDAESSVEPGQTWRCNEADADDGDVPEPHTEVSLWADHPRFRASIVDVLDGVAELAVGIGNSHPRTPKLGATIDVSVETLVNDPRWSRLDDRAVTDGGVDVLESDVNRPTARDLDPERVVYHTGQQGSKDPALHTDEDCRHASGAKSVYQKRAGVADPDRPVCQECLGCVQYGRPEGFDVNETRKSLLETEPEDLGLSPAGGRR